MFFKTIPTLEEWGKASSVFFARRTSDTVLQSIDELVNAYHDPNIKNRRVTTLFYLRSALDYWAKKVNVVPKNTPPTGLNSQDLPNPVKFSGSESRKDAIDALLKVVNLELQKLISITSDPNDVPNVKEDLMGAYGAINHGKLGDKDFLLKYPNDAIYFDDEGMQRKYKLRFRGGLAWRWNPQTGTYSPFDSTNNKESEINDKMVHFVMDQVGRIYCGFDKSVPFFKHSSLVGGADVLAAGRMAVVKGVITVVENDSGHYNPTYQHIQNLLHRLLLYGADISNTFIIRNSDKGKFPALKVAKILGSWPDGKKGF